MNDDEAIAAVTTEKERTQFVAALDAAEEWLYEGGEDAPAKEHRRVSHRHAQIHLLHTFPFKHIVTAT